MKKQGGFTIIELLVAIVVLAVGVLAMAASTGRVTRTLNGSRNATLAAQVASQRVEILRAAAASTIPHCSAAAFTSSAGPVSWYTGRVSETWVVPASGSLRRVLSIVRYPVGGGRTKTDTLATNIAC